MITIDRTRYTELEVVSNDHVLQKRRTVIQGYDKQEKKWVYIKVIKLTNAWIQKQYWRELMLGYDLDNKHIMKVSDNWFTSNEQGLEEAFLVYDKHLESTIDFLTRPYSIMRKNRLMFRGNLKILNMLLRTPPFFKVKGSQRF